MPDPEFGWGHDARRNSPSRKLNKDGTVRSVEPFITGFLQNNSYIGRPVDLHVMKDGSVLFSDDWNGAVYRVTYGGGPVARR